MGKLMVLAAGAAGYVLGTKAGRERYEQISRQAAKLRQNPTLQKKVSEAKDRAQEAAETAKQKARERGSSDSGTGTGGAGTGTSGGAFGRGDEGI